MTSKTAAMNFAAGLKGLTKSPAKPQVSQPVGQPGRNPTSQEMQNLFTVPGTMPQTQPQQIAKAGSDMTTPHIKTASEATPERLAAIDQFDAAQAFELGFAKAAHDLGLSHEQYQAVYEIAKQKLIASQGA